MSEEEKKTFYDSCDPEIQKRTDNFIKKLKAGEFKWRSPYANDEKLFEKIKWTDRK